ncbi:3'-5' exonuclease [Beijerinckia sp. L45]|uniref:3'-5' exonuclease n=1 Tax=Beijerinckia sp. L45 TaxID=1641855 RepID=UPI001AED2CB6|nr:3'-5' exonuclease [Beijerinckia sp. L45]
MHDSTECLEDAAGNVCRTLEGMVATLHATGAYRVLSRLDLPEGPCCTGGDVDTLVGLAIDLETSGLDVERHSIVECSMRRFRFDRRGAITAIGRPYTWLEDPGSPLDPAISALTGLSDADLVGQRMDDATALTLMRSAHVRVAYNASFDRRFIERRLPTCAGMAWACGLQDVDWRARGFDGSGRALGWILAQCGFFHGAHRAGNDVDALIAILRHETVEGRTAMAELMETACRPGWRFRAIGAHFDVKGRLKERGYRWDALEAVWCREVPDHARDDESAWLESAVYAPACRPRSDGPAIEQITWFTRYA